MSKTPFVSHSINGYSRYDIPENVATSASSGIIYPIRCSFMNARDVQYIQCGAVIRTNPAVVPTFTPFRVSLHRFFVPMQLYHPEMRVNSSKFNFESLSSNCFRTAVHVVKSLVSGPAAEYSSINTFNGRDLLSYLGLQSGVRNLTVTDSTPDPFAGRRTSENVTLGPDFVNADPILAYYDIIRSYYSFSQIDAASFAFPSDAQFVAASFSLPIPAAGATVASPTLADRFVTVGKSGQYWRQAVGSVSAFDDFYESAFYPRRREASGLYYNRTPELISMLVQSITGAIPPSDQSEFLDYYNYYSPYADSGKYYAVSLESIWAKYMPFGVAPSLADRFSRLLPISSDTDVSISNIDTVKGLAFASKLQAYKDLLTSGGSRFTDWLLTFFAAHVKHVDRPVLVYSSSFYLNSSPIFSQQGGETLGTYAGVIQGQEAFGKSAQRYCFDEPGYLIDTLVIRPVYYWAGIQKDFARYDKMDYFNPIFNEVGYESLPGSTFGFNYNAAATYTLAKQPCYNEFRASYDRVLGDLALVPNQSSNSIDAKTLWVQQRAPVYLAGNDNAPLAAQTYLRTVYFTDVNQANSIFASTSEDNFYVNLYYKVSSKSLVSKNFATNLATR